MPISYRRHGRDKTVLSSLVHVSGVNWIDNKPRQFCLVSTQFPICNCLVSNTLSSTENLEIGNSVETRQNWILSCRRFSSHRRHGQDKTSTVWNRHETEPTDRLSWTGFTWIRRCECDHDRNCSQSYCPSPYPVFRQCTIGALMS